MITAVMGIPIDGTLGTIFRYGIRDSLLMLIALFGVPVADTEAIPGQRN